MNLAMFGKLGALCSSLLIGVGYLISMAQPNDPLAREPVSTVGRPDFASEGDGAVNDVSLRGMIAAGGTRPPIITFHDPVDASAMTLSSCVSVSPRPIPRLHKPAVATRVTAPHPTPGVSLLSVDDKTSLARPPETSLVVQPFYNQQPAPSVHPALLSKSLGGLWSQRQWPWSN